MSDQDISNPPSQQPKPTPKYPDLIGYCTAVLSTGDSAEKCALTHEALDLFTNHNLPIGDQTKSPTISDYPARPDHLQVVHYTQIQGKVKGDTLQNNINRAVHQQCHIESYAVDLSVDIIVRFANYLCPDGTYLPREFFADWLLVADDEARHFTTWEARLVELGSHYGAFPTHDALWESALLTKHDLLARLSVVHLIHEAHGLDCGTRLLNMFLGYGDKKSANFFREITQDEVSHVAAGFRWYNYISDRILQTGNFQNGQHYQKSEEEIQQERFSVIKKHITTASNAQPDPTHLNNSDPAQPLETRIANIDAEQQTILANLRADPEFAGKAICQSCPDHIFDPILHFHHLVKENFHGAPRPPFNHELRLKAGMTPEWYEPLAAIKKEGEKLNVKQLMAQRKSKLAAAKAEGLVEQDISAADENTEAPKVC